MSKKKRRKANLASKERREVGSPATPQEPDRSSWLIRALAGEVGNVPRATLLVHFLGAAFLLYWYRTYCTDLWVASVDLPGHVAVIERLREQLLSFRIRFFDPHWFSGWPAFQFYAPLSHVLAALLSYPLGLISNEPARLSAHLFLLFSVLSIPSCLHYFAASLLGSYAEGKRLRQKPVQQAIVQASTSTHSLCLAASSIALGFWFLNHDYQWHGIGAAAALHVGLYSQALAWPFLLLYLSFLTQVLSGNSAKKPDAAQSKRLTAAALAFAAVFLCHSLTAIFALFVALVFWLLRSGYRIQIIRIHLIGILLSGFWIIPFFAYSSSYTGLDIYRPKGDFLELVFRYPLQGLLESARSAATGRFASLEMTNVVVLVLSATAFCWNVLHRSKVFVGYGIVLLLGVVVFSSGFVASSIPIGLHYYRFLAYLFLLLTAILLIIPIYWLKTSKSPRFVAGLIAIISSGIIVSNVFFPHYEYKRIQGLRGEEQFAQERQVLAYLKREPAVGRVLFSYFSDYEVYPFLSAHFLTSQLLKRNQQDTLNGLFIQSAASYRMPVASAVLLGIRGYHIPLLFTDNAELPVDVAFQQLLDSGVTHVVMGKKDLGEALANRSVMPVRYIGNYAILRIAQEPASPVQEVVKPVLAFSDLNGGVPYSLFQMYFYSKGALYTNFELVHVEEGESLPPGTVGLLVNGHRDDSFLKSYFTNVNSLPEVIRFQHNPHYSLDHYQVWYQHNRELDKYRALETYLDKQVGLPSAVLALPRAKRVSTATTPATLSLSENGQNLRLSNLTPGLLYKINYSYFPYWRSDAATLYHGMPGRIFATAHSSEVAIQYSLLGQRSTWLGYFCTLLGVYLCLPPRYRRRWKWRRSR